MIWRWSVIGMNRMNKNVMMKGYTANNVPCRYFIKFPVHYKKALCRLSILPTDNVPCLYFLNTPVDCRVVQCHLSHFRRNCVNLSNLMVKGPNHFGRVYAFVGTCA